MKLFLIVIVLLLLFEKYAISDVDTIDWLSDDDDDERTNISGELDDENTNQEKPYTTVDTPNWEIINDVYKSMLESTKSPDHHQFDRFETVTRTTYEINWPAVFAVICIKIIFGCVYAAIRYEPKERNGVDESPVQCNDKKSLLP